VATSQVAGLTVGGEEVCDFGVVTMDCQNLRRDG